MSSFLDDVKGTSVGVGESAHDKQPIYCAEQIRIPPELPDIIKDYAKFMIRQNPKDLIAASAEYFARKVQVGDARDLLGKNTADAKGFINNSSLEAFYSKFANQPEFRKQPNFSKDGTMVVKTDAIEAALEVGVSQEHVNDILTLGGWVHDDKLSWIQMWALLLATSSGSIVSTTKIATEVLQDNGKVATDPILAVFTYLADRDADLQKESERIKYVTDFLKARSPLVNASEFITFLQEKISSAQLLK